MTDKNRDNKLTDHWNSLAEELGAEVSPDEFETASSVDHPTGGKQSGPDSEAEFAEAEFAEQKAEGPKGGDAEGQGVERPTGTEPRASQDESRSVRSPSPRPRSGGRSLRSVSSNHWEMLAGSIEDESLEADDVPDIDEALETDESVDTHASLTKDETSTSEVLPATGESVEAAKVDHPESEESGLGTNRQSPFDQPADLPPSLWASEEEEEVTAESAEERPRQRDVDFPATAGDRPAEAPSGAKRERPKDSRGRRRGGRRRRRSADDAGGTSSSFERDAREPDSTPKRRDRRDIAQPAQSTNGDARDDDFDTIDLSFLDDLPAPEDNESFDEPEPAIPDTTDAATEEKPRRKKQRRRSSGRKGDEHGKPDQRDDSTAQSRDEGQDAIVESESTKSDDEPKPPKRFPSWQDAVGSIVSSNIAAREKTKSSGSGSQGRRRRRRK